MTARPLLRLLLALLLLPTLGAAATGAAAGAAATAPAVSPTAAGPARIGQPAQGALIYRLGRLATGQPVLAQRSGGGGALPPHAAACVACHRPSALGGIEGGVLVPPITGRLLFAAGQPPSQQPRLQRQWLRHQTRGAYSSALLARALQDGLDPDGTVLHPAMPRYQLDAQALADLEAYLRSRADAPINGLQAGVLHLASVVTPQAPPTRRSVVELAMQRWAQQLSLGGARVSWRVWALQGDAATWGPQLQAFWQAQPVYALLSGAGGADWAPVQAWCEGQHLPCLFPLIDRVPAADGQHWSLYLSAGVEGEARMLAQRLATLQPRPARVLQMHSGAAGAAAAQVLGDALRTSLPDVLALDLAAASPTSADDVVVLWLPSPMAEAWLAAQPVPGGTDAGGTGGRVGDVPRTVLSAQLAPPQHTSVPAAWRRRVLWISQRADPVREAAAAALSRVPWAQRLGLPPGLDPLALGDVHAATFFFGDALAQARGVLDPDYLLERLEQAVDRRPAGGGYFRLSLGPGQRVAAQGGHLLAFRPPDFAQLAPLPGYLRADD